MSPKTLASYWLLLVNLVLCAQSAYGHHLPQTVQLTDRQMLASPPPVLEVSESGALALPTDQLRTLVLPHNTSIEEVLRHFARNGDDQSGFARSIKLPAQTGQRMVSWMMFFYRTPDSKTPVLLAHPNLFTAQFTVWRGSQDGKSLDLLTCSGYKLRHPCQSRQTDSLENMLFPSAELAATSGRPIPVVVMLDTSPVDSTRLLLLSTSYLHRYLGTNYYYTGIFIGAMTITIFLGLFAAIRRRSADYLLLLMGISALTVWFVFSRRFSPGIENLPLRRFLLLAPFVLYFLINSIATKRILTPFTLSTNQKIEYGKDMPLIQKTMLNIAISINSIALLLLIAFTCDLIYLNPENLEWIGPSIAGVTPVLLLCSSLHAWLSGNRAAMTNVIIASQAIGACSSVLYLLASYTTLLDSPLPRALMSYLVPAEALVWALALGSRYQYLDMLVGKRIDAALKQEADRVRAEAADANRHREAAMQALDSSYRLLNQTQAKLIALIDCYTHTMQNLMSRLAIHIERSQKQPTEIKHQQHVTQLLQSISREVYAVADAVEDALCAKYPSANPGALLHWKIDQIRPALLQRNVQCCLFLAPDLDKILVDSYPFVETARELLCNVSRYATSGTSVDIRLNLTGGMLLLTVENTATLRDDEFPLTQGLPVEPAASTQNGDVSRGRGLYTLRRLLEHSGGYLSYASHPPSRVSITAGLPQRGIERPRPLAPPPGVKPTQPPSATTAKAV